jgi:hypothetical protein
MAHAAGFTGQRAVYTWGGRIHRLQELRFIEVKPGKSGAISHVLLWNPHWIIRYHHAQKTPGLIEANFNALLDRALEIGAKDMIEMPAAPIPSPPPEASTPIAGAAVICPDNVYSTRS